MMLQPFPISWCKWTVIYPTSSRTRRTTRGRSTTTPWLGARRWSSLRRRRTFDDPSGDGQLTLAFDYVHDGVKATEGGRQVVCVDFKSADGTVYDVDFYVDRSEGSDALLVKDTVIHKVSGKNVLSDARRAELDRQD